jgi:hypothetical protein
VFENEMDSIHQLGRVTLTPEVRRMLSDQELFHALIRHMSCGKTRPGTERSLDALPDCRVLSAYRCHTGRIILVITEADRTLTTLLLPEDC